jgi:hypothetical protein
MKNPPIRERYLDRTYIGYVKDTSDAKLAGRIRVWIPEFNSEEEDPGGWIVCGYLSPFGGATTKTKNSRSIVDTMQDTQTAYGFWAVPPDLNNEVLVMFPGGDINRAIWIGVLFKEYMLHEVPGIAASDKNKQNAGAVTNPGKSLPVSEYNKWDSTKDVIANPRKPRRPWHETRTRGIGEQGLIEDPIRGLTTSSAMRETPSHVVGLSTPGPVDPRNNNEVQGPARLGGNTFVMDDGDVNGKDEYIGFKTRTGASIRIDETNGLIYAINKKGTSWIQMDEDGNIDIFGAKSISMRTEQDFNLRADGDVNIEAGKNINMKAAQNTTEDGTLVKDGEGEGGDIYIQALNNLYCTVDDNAFLTVTKGNLDVMVAAGNKTEYVALDENKRIDGNVVETIQGNEDIAVLSNRTEYVALEENIRIDGGRTEYVAANEDIFIGGSRIERIQLDTDTIVDGNQTEYVLGTVETTVGGSKLEQINGTRDISIGSNDVTSAVGYTSMKASNYYLDSSGNLEVTGTITANDNMYAPDFQSGGLGLVGHIHHYTWTDDGGASDTATGMAGGGSLVHVSPQTAALPTDPQVQPEEAETAIEASTAEPALLIPMVTRTNVLLGFDGTAVIKLGNNQVEAELAPRTAEIPDYWKRETQEIDTIVGRLMTYEPCPAHLNKGIDPAEYQEFLRRLVE